MKKWLLQLVLALIALAPIAYVAYHQRNGLDLTGNPVVEEPENPIVATVDFGRRVIPALEEGAKLDVLTAKVSDGHIFNLCLEGNKWVDAHLTHATKPEATEAVVELLKSQPSAPVATLLRKMNNYWIVDFELTADGSRVRLVDYLKQKDLLL